MRPLEWRRPRATEIYKNRMEGKTSEQTNGPGALVLPLAWRHNFWQFYRIVVLVLPRIGSDRVGLSLPTPHFWVLAFVEHKTHLNSIRMWHFCIFFLFSWLCCCCCVRWHFGTLINVAKLFGGGGQSHWTLKSNSDSTFSSVFFCFSWFSMLFSFRAMLLLFVLC